MPVLLFYFLLRVIFNPSIIYLRERCWCYASTNNRLSTLISNFAVFQTWVQVLFKTLKEIERDLQCIQIQDIFYELAFVTYSTKWVPLLYKRALLSKLLAEVTHNLFITLFFFKLCLIELAWRNRIVPKWQTPHSRKAKANAQSIWKISNSIWTQVCFISILATLKCCFPCAMLSSAML